MKRQPKELEKILANSATDRDLISKAYKHLIHLTTTNQKQPNCDDPEEWDGEGGGMGGSGQGTHGHPWWIHVTVWQNQYNFVK